MNFEVLANLSWRDGLVAIIVLLTIYVFVVFLGSSRFTGEGGLDLQKEIG